MDRFLNTCVTKEIMAWKAFSRAFPSKRKLQRREDRSEPQIFGFSCCYRRSDRSVDVVTRGPGPGQILGRQARPGGEGMDSASHVGWPARFARDLVECHDYPSRATR